MRKKISYVVEITWLILTIVCLIAGAHKTYKYGIGNSYLFFLLAFIAVIMHMLRKYRRKAQKSKPDPSDE